MKNLNSLTSFVFITLVSIFALCFGGAQTVEAGVSGSFNGSTEYSVGSDFMSGQTQGYAYGTDAVVASISSHVSFHVHNDNEMHANIQFHVSGVWGDPSADSPYFDFLEEHGLSSSTSFSSNSIVWNGEYYEFDEEVGLSGSVDASLWRDFEDVAMMEGNFWTRSFGFGMIPTYSWVNINEYEEGHPDWLPDWEVNFGSSWLVTTPFHRVVPTPGTAGILFAASLCFFRGRKMA